MNKQKYYWLNKESRTFLSRGYINETPEQRIKDIANKAEGYLKIDGEIIENTDFIEDSTNIAKHLFIIINNIFYYC